VEQILETVGHKQKKCASEWVCLTGGEPLEQKIEGLVRSLRREGFKVQLETNGTIYRRLGIDWITVSPKPPEYFFRTEYTTKAKEVKLVVSRELSLNTIQDIRKAFPRKTPVLLQPQSNRSWSAERGMKLLCKAKKAGLGSIRLTVQAHKIFGFK
jgi:organic radical activating enzyme